MSDRYVIYNGKRYRNCEDFIIKRDTIDELKGCYDVLGEVWDEMIDDVYEAYERIPVICKRFLDANPPMFTDTMIGMYKLIDMVTIKSDDEVLKAHYICHEVYFTLKNLNQSIEYNRVRDPFSRAVLWIVHLIRPEIIDIDYGYEWRPGLSLRYTYWQVKRKMARDRRKSEREGRDRDP